MLLTVFDLGTYYVSTPKQTMRTHYACQHTEVDDSDKDNTCQHTMLPIIYMLRSSECFDFSVLLFKEFCFIVIY